MAASIHVVRRAGASSSPLGASLSATAARVEVSRHKKEWPPEGRALKRGAASTSTEQLRFQLANKHHPTLLQRYTSLRPRLSCPFLSPLSFQLCSSRSTPYSASRRPPPQIHLKSSNRDEFNSKFAQLTWSASEVKRGSVHKRVMNPTLQGYAIMTNGFWANKDQTRGQLMKPSRYRNNK